MDQSPITSRISRRLALAGAVSPAWLSLEQGELATAEWVDWWNQRRLHSAIDNLPPADYEADSANAVDDYAVVADLDPSQSPIFSDRCDT